MSNKKPFLELLSEYEKLIYGVGSTFDILEKEIKLMASSGWEMDEFVAARMRHRYQDINVASEKASYDIVSVEYEKMFGAATLLSLLKQTTDPKEITKLVESENRKLAEYLGTCGWEYIDFMNERNSRAGVTSTDVVNSFRKIKKLLVDPNIN